MIEEPPIPAQPPAAAPLPLSPVRATYLLIGINLVIFAADWLLALDGTWMGGLIPAAVLAGGEWWRLISSGFLHAGLLHVAMNMYALYLVGQQLERVYGTGRFLGIYGVALLGGSALVTLFSDWRVPTIGASGAVLGLFGALAVYFWVYRDNLAGARAQLNGLIQVLVLNLVIGLIPGVSLWGHLGGALAGAAAGWAFLPRYEARVSGFQMQLRVRPLTAADWGRMLLSGVVEGLILGLAFFLRR